MFSLHFSSCDRLWLGGDKNVVAMQHNAPLFAPLTMTAAIHKFSSCVCVCGNKPNFSVDTTFEWSCLLFVCLCVWLSPATSS